jgi:5'-deoxynucleotidase YfbR-like HD superfamily hydrolase
MAVCRATKANGEPCTLAANGPQGFCWAHDPANREKRRRMASKAARSKPNREIPAIKALLEDLIERVLAGDLETGRAAVANQLINTRLRAIETERKIKETEELEARIEALEQVPEVGRGAKTWRT